MWVRILGGVNVLVWAFWVWTGVGLSRGVVEQHVPGYPNFGQIAFYVGFPAIALVVCLVFAVWSLFSKRRWILSMAGIVQVTAVIALLPFVLFYGGGV